MQFCPKCGAMLVPKGKKFACPKCRYTTNNVVKMVSSENIPSETRIDVLKEKDSNVFPTVSATCPKCGFLEAETWATQMRASDEAETIFFRCKKCRNTWRERTD
jgi:DNA-directed RNA polymerase subunit M